MSRECICVTGVNSSGHSAPATANERESETCKDGGDERSNHVYGTSKFGATGRLK